MWNAAGSWPRVDQPGSSRPALVIALSSGFSSDSGLDPIGTGRLTSATRLALGRGISRLVTTRRALKGFTSDFGQRSVIAATGYQGPWTIVTPLVETTRGEAMALSAELPGRYAIVVVTSRFHTRRACAAFEQVGFTVECVNGYDDPRWWRVPYDYLYERAAVLKYRWKGWIQ